MLILFVLALFINASNVSAANVTADQVANASGTVKSYVETNHTLPSSVNVSGNVMNMSNYLGVSTSAILNINSSSDVAITIKSFGGAPSPSENITSRNINKTEYLNMARSVRTFMDTNGRAPNYATQTSTGSTIRYESLIYMFSQILNSYKINGVLPDYITVTPWSTVSNSSTIFFSLNQINNAAGNVDTFINTNDRLPNYVTISGIQVSMPQFLGLSTTALLNINANLNTSIALKSFGNATSPLETITSGNINKTEYLDIANRAKSYMDSNGNAPNYASTSLGNMRFESLVYMYSRILSYYNTTNVLLNSITVNPWINGTNVIGSTSYGYVEKEFYGNQSSNKTIVLIIGMHPQENGIHTAIYNALVSKSANLTKRYVLYYIHVTQNADDYNQGRMNGQLLGQQFIVPDVSSENPMLVIDCHENHGADSGYTYYRFLYPISNTTITMTYANQIISQMPFLVIYPNPPNPTSPQYVTIPIANQGIPTIIYETLFNDTVTKKASDANTLINALDGCDGTAPTVSSIDPVNNAKIYVLNKVITVTFSEPIQAGSAYNNINVTNADGIIKQMSKSISGNVLTLTPTENYTGGIYTINIPINAIIDLAGNSLTTAYNSTFTVTVANVHGIWLTSTYATTVDIDALTKASITDIFVKVNQTNYKSVLTTVLNKTIGTGIQTHAWITCFKDAAGNWVDPQENYTYISNLISFISNVTEANYTINGINYSIDGIHLDYVRYPGTAYKYTNGTAAITSFVQQVYNTVKSINPLVAVSAALMPETTVNAYYYGQDYTQLSNYLDLLVPMIYKGNYNKDTSWIGSTVNYIVAHANGTPVVAGLQTYESDSNATPIPVSELQNDINVAISNGSSGYVLFRYGLIDDAFFNKFTLTAIQNAATNVKSFIEANNRLPNYVTIDTNQITMPQFLQMLITSLLQINSGISTPISPENVTAPTNPTGDYMYGNIGLTEYLSIAQSIKSFIDTNGVAPNYATSSLGNIQYESLVYMFSKILDFYKTNSRLPNYVTVDSSVINTGIPSELQQYLKETANCQVTNSQITSLAASITNGLYSSYDKAIAIFNWVRDNISYSFYYNTKYGAVGTLNARTGNCVDTSHLLIALERAAGIPARYVHGYCKFSSGWYGHVWAQVWVNGEWYTADATSSRNTFGVINNWDTATATIYGTYASLPF